MTLIQKSITINAPAERVWEILDDMEVQSELNPNLKILSHIPAPIGGHNIKWEYKMAGMTFSGETTMIEFDRPKREVFDSKGGIDSRWEWTLTSQGSTTDASLKLEYTMPGSFLGAAFNKLVIQGQNEQDIEEQLANLKRLAEK
jgi:uncharacterized membrane protein